MRSYRSNSLDVDADADEDEDLYGALGGGQIMSACKKAESETFKALDDKVVIF